MGNRALAIDKAQEVIDAWVACNNAGKTPGARAVVDIKAEELIDHLLAEFDGDLSKFQVVAVFDGSQQWLTTDALAQIPDEMVPIAVVRELLWKHKIMFNPKNVSNWSVFVQRFGRYILSS